MNFKVTRIGLLNFWYFDDEEFNFFDGKLLLRGSNGSGKSITMQSFIPLILDGNKLPSRLDPFGTKEKRIEDYLLGPADGEQEPESTGYLYMETFNEAKNKYVTIGIGLHAKKGRPTDFWGFALKDGKRIGKDFQLYKYNTKILMPKRELRANIGKDNIFVETTKEYKAAVNDLLFGFPSIDAYDEFINVLLQLRSSKLSKDYNPTKLMSILTSVLQPLSESDIRPISEAIEDTNKTKEKIETLNNNLKSIFYLSKTYQNYNEIQIYNKAKRVEESKTKIQEYQRNLSEKEKNKSQATLRLQEIEESISALEQEKTEIETKLNSIDNKDLKESANKLNELKQELAKIEKYLSELRQKLVNAREKENSYQHDLATIEDKIYGSKKTVNNIREEILSINEDVKIPNISIIINSDDINYDFLKSEVAKYKIKLNQIKEKLENKEKLESEISYLEEQNISQQKAIAFNETERNKLIETLSTAIMEFKDAINLLFSKSKIFQITENVKKKIFDIISEYNCDNFIKAKEEYQKEIKYFEEITKTDKNKILNKIETTNKDLTALKEELRILQENKEIEYQEEEITAKSEAKLKEKNIPYIALYKVIEFKHDIKETDRNRLEELLISMNILNAKLIPEKYLKEVKDIKSIFLKKGTPQKNNILKYFDVIENEVVSIQEIQDILASINIDEADSFYINTNNYALDFLIGYPSCEYQSKYIGLLKREEEHKLQVRTLEKSIEEHKKIINNYQNMLDSINNKIRELEQLYESFPKNTYLEEINDKIKIKNIEIETQLKQSNSFIKSINQKNEEIQKLIVNINSIKENITIPLNLISYQTVLRQIETLKDQVNDLENEEKRTNILIDEQNSKKSSIEDLCDKIEDLLGEENERDKKYRELSAQKRAIEEILENPDNKKLIEELEQLTAKIKLIPETNNALREEKGKLKNSVDELQKDIESIVQKLSKEKLIMDLKKYILEKEFNLHYIFKKEDTLDLNKILSNLKHRENNNLTDASNNYFEAFNKYKQELLDYRLTTKKIFTSNEKLIEDYEQKGLEKEEILKVMEYASRDDLETIYQGKKLTLFELNEQLKAAIDESKNYISEQERKLFEDILLKTIGGKIRDKIESSKEWIKRMNEIMKSTQIDSNLSFELEWKSKTAFTEDELDTKELVRLFKIDASQLNKEDSDKLINHFQSRIKKELEFNEKINDSYSNVIFNVLDYRNWFEFKLYYKRKGAERKELTNKVFSVLSGGERAKSMYVPLFAAVYAKLLNAKPESLRLIALDEAFAGVDNANIREMFSILSQLNLDYILTSQSLWGDYDTIKELSICELIKDEVHKAVGVRHYKWNGHAKEILEKGDIYAGY